MKQCRRCFETKPNQDFPAAKANKDGLHSYCRKCHNAYMRERYASKPRTDEQRANARVYARTYRYGIKPEDYSRLLEEQDHSCAVCKEQFTDALKPNVDHDHRCCPGVVTCGRCVRGLLCSPCTAFAGMIETRFDTHEDMFTYLHLHHNQRWSTIKVTEQSKS